MSNVNHGSWGRLVWRFQGNEGRWTSKNYMNLAEKEKRQFLFGKWGEAKFMFILVRMCGVCLDFHSNELGT